MPHPSYRGFTVAVALLAPFLGPGRDATAQSRVDPTAYAAFLDSLMQAAGVPGISVAFFSSEGVSWEYTSGVKSTESGEPIGPETVFEAASISKPVFAVLFQSLVRDGLIELERPIVEYEDPVPGLGHDRRSQLLTPEMLLSHQGGLPNWRTRINLAGRGVRRALRSGGHAALRGRPGSRVSLLG